MGRQLGIDFSLILVDFGTQVGKQNRTKIVQKRHRKNDEKNEGQQDGKKVATRGPNDPCHLASWSQGRSPPLRWANSWGLTQGSPGLLLASKVL